MIKIYVVPSVNSDTIWSNERRECGFWLPLCNRRGICGVTSSCCSFLGIEPWPYLGRQSTWQRMAALSRPCTQVWSSACNQQQSKCPILWISKRKRGRKIDFQGGHFIEPSIFVLDPDVIFLAPFPYESALCATEAGRPLAFCVFPETAGVAPQVLGSWTITSSCLSHTYPLRHNHFSGSGQ